jgi:hypothetical protein
MKTRTFWLKLFSLSIIIILAACGEKATPAPTPTTAPAPTETPDPTKTPMPTPTSTPIPTATPIPTPTPWPILVAAKIPDMEFTLDDSDSSTVWWEKRTITGDNYYEGQLERPFTAKEMVYQPDLDILHASMASGDKFFYFTITLRDVDKTSQAMTGNYGIEFDRTKTGRGDFLVWAHDVKKDWSVENILVFVDPDKDIGGLNPWLSNPDFKGDGYESQLKMEGEKVAYSRYVPGEPPKVEIAVSRLLLEDAKEFLWNAWADKGLNDPGRFDYNDHFTFREAGSPIKTDEVYPLAALFSVDNTCRKPFGFSPKGYIPGTCQTGGAGGGSSNGGSCICLQTHGSCPVAQCGCLQWNNPNCP